MVDNFLHVAGNDFDIIIFYSIRIVHTRKSSSFPKEVVDDFNLMGIKALKATVT